MTKIQTNSIVRNDGMPYAFVHNGSVINLTYGGGRPGSHFGEVGQKDLIAVTHDFQVGFSGRIFSDPMTEDELRLELGRLGLTLELDNPRERVKSLRNPQGELNVNLEALLAMAGLTKSAVEWETTSDGLVFMLSSGRRHENVGPYDLTEARREAYKVVQKARSWIHANMRGFKRSVKVSDWDAVQLWKVSTQKNFVLIHCKVGETVEIPKQGGSYFGSGGGWGSWQVFGEVTEELAKTNDNGFVEKHLMRVSFHKGPAAVLTTAGDSINGGRTFYRRLYVAE